jgi:uncharacterized protein with von Willebrand factor type A (vWA) domain
MTAPAGPALVHRLVEFCAALRTASVPVSVAEELDAARVFGVVELLEREQLRAGLAAALLKRPGYRRTFDVLFDLWFPLATGEPLAAPAPGARPAEVDGLRSDLADALRAGDLEALRRIAQQAVGALGQADSQPGRQSWFSYRVLRLMQPETLIAALLDALLAGEPRGGMAEKLARTAIEERIKAFRGEVEAEVRRRVAEERGVRAVARTTVPALIDQVDFLRATRDDLAALRRTVQPLARRLATRLAARRRLAHRGRLDVRRTIRASLATGGVPVVTHHRPRRPHKPELVVLCDVSGSAAGFAHFTLLLTSALREQFSRVRAFAFIDSCDEVTKLLGDGMELPDAVARMGREADLVAFDGHSDYGNAFEVFADRWPDAVGPNTSLLILGDARNNYRPPALPTLRRLVGSSRHAYWLNPEPAGQWGSGDSIAPKYAKVVPMFECRNAAQLATFIEQLLPA